MSLLSIKFSEDGLPRPFTNVKPSLPEHNDDQIREYLGDFIMEKKRPKNRSRVHTTKTDEDYQKRYRPHLAQNCALKHARFLATFDSSSDAN